MAIRRNAGRILPPPGKLARQVALAHLQATAATGPANASLDGMSRLGRLPTGASTRPPCPLGFTARRASVPFSDAVHKPKPYKSRSARLTSPTCRCRCSSTSCRTCGGGPSRVDENRSVRTSRLTDFQTRGSEADAVGDLAEVQTPANPRPLALQRQSQAHEPR